MSGLETAAAVYGVISGTITIIQVSIQIYDAVKDKSGIPPKLRAVSDKLPSLVEILQDAEAQYKVGQPDESTWVSAAADVKRCEEACQELQDLLKSAYPEKDAGRVRCFLKSTGTVVSGKHRTAEQLLAQIWEYLKLLVDRSILTSTALLEDIKKTVDELLEGSGLTQHNVYGTNIGRDQVYHNTHNGTGQMFTGPGGTFNSHQGSLADLQEANKLKKLQDDEDRIKKLREWLQFDTIDHRKADIVEPHEKTFQWIFQSSPSISRESFAGSGFTKWLQNGDGLFWVQGILGSGKSTLMKYIDGHPSLRSNLDVWARGNALHLASFYFTKTGSSVLQRSLQGLYRTLLATLIQYNKHFAFVAFPSWQVSDNHTLEPPVGILRDAMQKILKSHTASQRFCFLIDGLDEYEENDSRLKSQLAEDVISLANLPGIKIVVASRPEPSFASRFSECPTIHLHKLTKHDIIEYVCAEFSHDVRTGGLTKPEMMDLAGEVVFKAKGVFLWVYLAVTNILNSALHGATYTGLKAEVGMLHKDLYLLFDQILSIRVQPQYRQEVARCLMMAKQHRKHVNGVSEGNPVGDSRMRLWFRRRKISPLAIYSVGERVDELCSYNQVTVMAQNSHEIRSQAEMLTNRLPPRSCGMFRQTTTGIQLLHSSMDEFLDRPEVAENLQHQAGKDFDVHLALAAGRIADLVLLIDEIHEKDIAGWPGEELEKPQYPENLIMAQLLEILQCIESTKPAKSSQRTKLMFCLDALPWKRLAPSEASRLIDITIDEDFTARILASDIWPIRRGSLPLLAVHHGCKYYIQHLLQSNSTFPSKTLLLKHAVIGAFSFGISFQRSSHGSQIPIVRELRTLSLPVPATLSALGGWDGGAHFSIAEKLLEDGADPNQIVDAESPWQRTLWEIQKYHVEQGSTLVPLSEGELMFRKVCSLAKCMLDHGADPMGVVHPPAGQGLWEAVSTDVFAKMYDWYCCGTYRLRRCTCASAERLLPVVRDLIDLVQAKRDKKRHREQSQRYSAKRKRGTG